MNSKQQEKASCNNERNPEKKKVVAKKKVENKTKERSTWDLNPEPPDP
jgi:hypothetical protein